MENKFMYRIRDLRREMNISGEQLGKILNVGKTTISQWENGINYPNQDTLNKLCDYFNCSFDYLMGRSDVKQPYSKQATGTPDIASDDFLVAFSGLSSELTEEDKQTILKMAQAFAASNEAKKDK